MEINVTGAKVFMTLGGQPFLTETIVNMWIVMAAIILLCIFLTRGMKVHACTKRQIIAEWIVQKVNGLVNESMGPRFSGYGPFIAALMSLSCLSSLSSMIGMYAATSDLSVLIGWALLVFVLITYMKLRSGGIGGYLKGYIEPIPILLPFNIISEIATPFSMAFRHFGNIASGTVITTLIYASLAAVSHLIFSHLPGMLGEILGAIPILQVGIPAVLSVYFDLFSSGLQAFIFCMLTMMYISSAAEG